MVVHDFKVQKVNTCARAGVVVRMPQHVANWHDVITDSLGTKYFSLLYLHQGLRIVCHEVLF